MEKNAKLAPLQASLRKNSVRIKLSQRQFGIEVRKYEMLSGIYIRWFY